MQPVKLSEIIQGIETHLESYDVRCFLEAATGEVVCAGTSLLSQAEEEEDEDDLERHLPEWQQGELALARRVMEEPGSFLNLPSAFEVHEYSIMEDFCFDIEDERVRARMMAATTGSGAFRRFKRGIHEYDIADDWYRYRDERIKQIAIEWCKENGVTFINDTPAPQAT